MRYRKTLLVFTVLAAFVATAVFETESIDARGWHYKLKRPPRKRPRPKKNRNAYIQTDPLRIVKNFNDPDVKVGPSIVLAMDTSIRMQYDSEGWYYDESYWDADASFDAKHGEPDPRVIANSLGVAANARYYRRKYKNLVRTELQGNKQRFDADSIAVVDDKNADYATFYDTSRLGMARDGLLQAVQENMYIVNWGMVMMRYQGGKKAKIPDKPGNQTPVYLSSPAQRNLTGDVGDTTWNTTWVLPTQKNVDQNNGNGTSAVPVFEGGGTSADAAYWLMQPVDSDHQDRTLVPAGRDAGTFEDSPVKLLLDDARADVIRIMSKDKSTCRGCRNTAVILVVGGNEGGSVDPVASAAAFQAVTSNGVTRKVPVYVIAVDVPDADLPQLQAIADAGGGELFEAYGAMDIAFAANYVAQSVFRRAAAFDAGDESEFLTTSPIVGSVDLTNAKDITGAALPYTNIYSGGAISQSSNVVLTAGFSLPGFEAKLRAFRAYKPVPDATKPYGYRFVKDGTRLWVAHPPAESQRNIYTYIPSTGQYVAFTQANATALKPYLGINDIANAADADAFAAQIIDFVRQQPLGAIIGSTPAIVGPPGLSPAPDSDYKEFANDRRTRRSTVFYGGNDGMIHAIDGRLGVEVWAFIPFNLLPQLQTLLDGQSVDSFDYFVDSSPKIADVRIGGQWRTCMFIGEGAGGTFYLAFDISDANLGVPTTSDSETAVLAGFAASNVIPFLWSFPSMSSFDYTWSTSDMPYGDLKSSATALEKTVGWAVSDPAVGQVGDATSPWVLFVGSGFLPLNVQAQVTRGGKNAGTTFYVLDAATGAVKSSVDVGDDKTKESLKAALEADPSATGPDDSRFIDRIYIGDTEGALWRFWVTRSGTNISLSTATKIYDAAQWNPIYTSAALLKASATNQQYVYITTGIDILPWTRLKKIQQFDVVGLLDTGGSSLATKQFDLKLDKADSKGGDERPSSNPTVAGGIVFFTTTTDYPDTPCKGADAALFALTASGGVAYDLNRDGQLNSNDAPFQQAIGRATGVFVADRHLYFGTDQGVEIFGDPEGFNNSIIRSMFRTLAWRELR